MLQLAINLNICYLINIPTQPLQANIIDNSEYVAESN